MFHTIDGHHQSLELPNSEAFLNNDMTDSEDHWNRDSDIDFSKLEPLNPNGYMYVSNILKVILYQQG